MVALLMLFMRLARSLLDDRRPPSRPGKFVAALDRYRGRARRRRRVAGRLPLAAAAPAAAAAARSGAAAREASDEQHPHEAHAAHAHAASHERTCGRCVDRRPSLAAIVVLSSVGVADVRPLPRPGERARRASARRPIRWPPPKGRACRPSRVCRRIRCGTSTSCTRPRASCSTTYGWVDKSAGVVRIPIDRAIEILARDAADAPAEAAKPCPHAARRSGSTVSCCALALVPTWRRWRARAASGTAAAPGGVRNVGIDQRLNRAGAARPACSATRPARP